MSEKQVQWICAVCNSPMETKGKCEKCQPPWDFKPEYFWAFMTMMLHMHGKATQGAERFAISLEQLEKFDPEQSPEVKWEPATKSWVIENQPNTAESHVIIATPNKLNFGDTKK